MILKKRVRLHLKEDLPSVEGLLVSRRNGEYLIGVPKLITDTTLQPAELVGMLAVPKANVAFYEVI